MESSLVGFKSKFEQAKERISKLEDRKIEITKSEEQKETAKEKQKQSKGSMGHHPDDQHTHCGAADGREREKGAE